MERTAAAIAGFAEEAEREGPERLYAFAHGGGAEQQKRR